MKRILFLAIFISCNGYAAGIQKWADENGQVHYGDSPPAQTQTESIRVSRPPSNPGKALPRFTGSKDAEDAATETGSTKKQAQTETSEEVDNQQCAQAQKDLKTLNRSARIRLKLDDGTVRYMSQEEKDERRKITEEDIKQFCK